MDSTMREFLEGAEFLSLPPIKQKYLREMVGLLEGRTMNEKVQILLSYSFKMQNDQVALSREEANMLIGVLQENLTPEERIKFEQISQMF